MNVPRLLVAAGVLLLLAGLLWPFLSKLGLGRLPGDSSIRREGFSLHFPLMTSLVLSGVLTLVLWLIRR